MSVLRVHKVSVTMSVLRVHKVSVTMSVHRVHKVRVTRLVFRVHKVRVKRSVLSFTRSVYFSWFERLGFKSHKSVLGVCSPAKFLESYVVLEEHLILLYNK